MDRVRVVITTPLEDHLVEAIAQTDPRVEVVYERPLVPTPRYPADHSLPVADTLELQERWRGLLVGAEVLFDFGPRTMVDRLVTWPRLRWIQATSAGVGQFAARASLTKSDIIVTTASGVHARPLAEFVLMTLLMFNKGALRSAIDQRAHRWERYAGREIAGQVVGIVGVGRIGREIARTLRGLDARVVGIVREPNGRRAEEQHLDRLLPTKQIDEILGEVDALVLSCPHTPETENLLNARRLAALRPDAVLINVARGSVVDEEALTDALQAGRLKGAALDVFGREPLDADSPLWDLPNVIICPHSASTAESENQKIVDLFRDNLRRYLNGLPLHNVLNYDLMY